MTDSTCFVIPEILFGEVFERKIQTRTASTKSRAEAFAKFWVANREIFAKASARDFVEAVRV